VLEFPQEDIEDILVLSLVLEYLRRMGKVYQLKDIQALFLVLEFPQEDIEDILVLSQVLEFPLEDIQA
jgi:hypothetical protein